MFNLFFLNKTSWAVKNLWKTDLKVKTAFTTKTKSVLFQIKIGYSKF